MLISRVSLRCCRAARLPSERPTGLLTGVSPRWSGPGNQGRRPGRPTAPGPRAFGRVPVGRWSGVDVAVGAVVVVGVFVVEPVVAGGEVAEGVGAVGGEGDGGGAGAVAAGLEGVGGGFQWLKSPTTLTGPSGVSAGRMKVTWVRPLACLRSSTENSSGEEFRGMNPCIMARTRAGFRGTRPWVRQRSPARSPGQPGFTPRRRDAIGREAVGPGRPGSGWSGVRDREQLVGAGDFQEAGDLRGRGVQADGSAVPFGGQAGLEEGVEAGGSQKVSSARSTTISPGQSGRVITDSRASYSRGAQSMSISPPTRTTTLRGALSTCTRRIGTDGLPGPIPVLRARGSRSRRDTAKVCLQA